MLEMVRSGVGLSLCRDSIALHQRQSFGLAVSESVSVPASLSFVTLSQRRNGPLISALLDALGQTWQV